jgi:xylulokinase
VGSLKPEIGKELGLTEEIPVVIGTADAQAAALAAGATSANESIMICGTTHLWEIIQSEEPKFMKYFINCHYIFPGLYLSAAALMTTGAVIDWFLKNFLMTTPENSFQMLKTLESQARVIKPGSEGIIVLPYFMGERSPIWDPNAKGLFLGLSLRHTSAHLYRAILEGIAYALKSCEEIFESAGLMPSEVIAIDGASKNKLWMEIISSVLRIPIKSPRPRLSSAAGAGILAGYGVGIFKKKEDLKKFLSYEIIAEPNPKESEEYEKLYQIFKKLYPALKEYMHAL